MTPKAYGFNSDGSENRDQLRVVWFAKDLAILKYSLRRIAEILTRAELRTPNGNEKWNHNTVAWLIRNPRYARPIIGELYGFDYFYTGVYITPMGRVSVNGVVIEKRGRIYTAFKGKRGRDGRFARGDE